MIRAETSDRRFLMLVIAGGVALRLVWLAQVHGIGAFVGAGEATRVAMAVARGDGIADAYFQGYGPTAHLMPLSPAIAGAILWLFGPVADLALTVWALAQSVAAWLMLHRLFARLGAAPVALRWGMILLALLPVFVPEETVDFRYWEGAAAVALACANLLLILRFEERRPGRKGIAAMAGLSALTFFVSPIAGLGIYGCWALHALRQPPARIAAMAGTAALALALLVVPWALRNQAVLGVPVLLRSNFGLELALANHPGALSATPPEKVYAERMLAIHPYHSPAARAALAEAGGEVAYSRALGAEARAWIAGHPADFARLALRHLRQFFFPAPWEYYFTDWEGLRGARAAIVSLVAALGLAGLGWGVVMRRRGYTMLAVYVGLVALPYAIVQPIPRYSYLVFGLLAFAAVDALVERYARKGPGTAR